jgi:two-component system KDP operon response regulator KdpE
MDVLRSVWGEQYLDAPQYVHVYISRLRRKLEKDPENPEYLITEHRVGYRFVKMNPRRA